MTDKLAKSEVLDSTKLPPDEDDAIRVGQWYWVRDDEEDQEPALKCVVRLGSNYIKLRGVRGGSTRVHLNEFNQRCTREQDPDGYIDKQIEKVQKRVHKLMDRVKEVTARLGVAPSAELTTGNETAALAKVNSDDTDFKAYEKSLVKAKKTTLPKLFEEIRSANESLAAWMTAKVIPLKAQAEGMRGVIEQIDDRIFSVELYAGLTEQVEQIADGHPAALTTKVHLIQRRHYMDEECLARYEVGGMEFKNIGAFDAWLVRPENLERLLPFQRCIVAFRVRRRTKEREGFDLSDFVRIINEQEADKRTFLYIRNGEQVFRMSTAIDFEEKLFPDMERGFFDGKLWADTSFGSIDIDRIITDDDYQERKRKYAEELSQWSAAKKAAKKRGDKMGPMRPYSTIDRYEPFTKESVYYDDISAKIAEEMKKHNRIGLIVQGLLDRSPTLHPHPPWQIWTAEGFKMGLVLIYDDSRALPAGDKPDFEAFRAKLNKSLKVGSLTVGQEEAWERFEADKEYERQRQDYRVQHPYHSKRYRPYGNPGPGVVARVVTYSKKKGEVSYAWHRERLTSGPHGNHGDPVRTTYSCKTSKVLNVDAYTPGDFRQFFDDPRTRAEYLKWAPLLLEAEEYHAGNREVLEPPEPEAKRSTYEGRKRYEQRRIKKLFLGKAVKNVEQIETQGGMVYKVGSLWRVVGGSGRVFEILGITPDGKREPDGNRYVTGVNPRRLEIVHDIPEDPGSLV